MIWCMEILRTYIEQQLLVKYWVIKYLVLLKIQNMMDIKQVLLQWFINFLIKETSGSGIKNEIISNKELAEELHKPSLETFRKEKYTHAAQKVKLPVKDFFSQ